MLNSETDSNYYLKIKGLYHFLELTEEKKKFTFAIEILQTEIKNLYLTPKDRLVIGHIFPMMDELIVLSDLGQRPKAGAYCQNIKAWPLFMQQASTQKRIKKFTFNSIKSTYQLIEQAAALQNKGERVCLPYIEELSLSFKDLFASNSLFDSRVAIDKERHQDLAVFIKQTFPAIQALNVTLNDYLLPLAGMEKSDYLDRLLHSIFLFAIPARTDIKTLTITIDHSDASQDFSLSKSLSIKIPDLIEQSLLLHLPGLHPVTLRYKHFNNDESKEQSQNFSHNGTTCYQHLHSNEDVHLIWTINSKVRTE